MSRGNGATPPGQQGPPEPQAPSRVCGPLKYRLAHEVKPDFWSPGLIDGILESQAMTVMYGPSGCGKTAVSVDMAGRIAAGMLWRGRQVDKGLVVYVAAENANSTGRRLWAWMDRHGLRDTAIPLVLVETPVILDGKKSVEALTALIKQVQDETGADPRLTNFDTLARTMPGDENMTKDMSDYVKLLDSVRDISQAHVMTVHHTGKVEARGARGSSALKAATDHELELAKPKGSRVGVLTLTKVREGDLEGERLGYELMPRELGYNRLDRKVTTVVIEECDAPMVSAERGKNAEQHEQKVEAFMAMTPGVVSFRRLREHVRLTEPGSSQAAERGAWKRLRDRNFIQVDQDDLVTLV